MERLFLKFLSLTFNWIFYRSFYRRLQYVPKGNRSEFDVGMVRQKRIAESCRPDRSLGAYVIFGEQFPLRARLCKMKRKVFEERK